MNLPTMFLLLSCILLCFGVSISECKLFQVQDVPPPHKFNTLPFLNTEHSLTLETHYTGYVSTGSGNGTEMFYWFQESRSNPDQDPIIVWLQGGYLNMKYI